MRGDGGGSRMNEEDDALELHGGCCKSCELRWCNDGEAIFGVSATTMAVWRRAWLCVVHGLLWMSAGATTTSGGAAMVVFRQRDNLKEVVA